MRRSKAADHSSWIVIALLLILSIGGITWRHWSPRKKLGHARQQKAIPRSDRPVSATAPELAATAFVHHDEQKLLRTGSKARLRVRPGETAVMGYHEIAPGKLGLTIVTPAALDDGHVSLQVRTLEMRDSVELRSYAEDILPDVFELERSGVISETRMNELLRCIQNDSGVKSVTYPRMTTRPGQGCTMSSGVNDPGGRFTGASYALQADSIQDAAGGFDLSVEFDRSATPFEE